MSRAEDKPESSCESDQEPHRASQALPPAEAKSQGGVPTHAAPTFESLDASGSSGNLAPTMNIYEFSPAMLHSIDPQGRIISVSERWLRTLGYAREEVIGRMSVDFLTEASRQRARQIVAEFFVTGRAENVAYQMVCKSGKVIDVLMSATLERDRSGQPLRSYAYTEDVTARLQAENALLEQRNRMSAILDGTGAGTWAWNVQTGEMKLDQRLADNTGRSLDEVHGLSREGFRALVHPEDIDRSVNMLKQHFAGELPQYSNEYRIRHRDGHWTWVRDRGRLLTRTEDGSPEWMFGIQVDITESRLQQEAIRRSEELLSRVSELANVGGWELDIASGTVIWSAQTRHIHGVGSDYQPNVTDGLGFYTPQARPLVEAAVRNAIEAGESWDLEVPFIPASGQQIWVRTTGKAIREDDQIVRLVGAFQDVSAQVLQRQALEYANRRMRVAADSGSIGIWERDLLTDVLTWDDSMYRLYGLEQRQHEPLFDLWLELLHPSDRWIIRTATEAALAGRQEFDVTFRVIRPDDSIRHMRATARIDRDDRGEPIGMIGVTWDVTAIQLNAEMARQHELLRVTLQSIGDAVITTDQTGHVTWLNPVAEHMTGWSVEEAQGQPLTRVFNIINEETRAPTENPVQLCLQRGKVVGLANHTVLISRDGQEFGIEDSAAPIRSDADEILGVVLVFHDVTEQRRISSELNYRATHDALTDLVNRVEFQSQLERTVQMSLSDRGKHALMIIDLDQFKLVNDACGHAAGDQILQQTARILSDMLRACDTLARLGGDEFAIIVEHCDADDAMKLAQRICEQMDQFRFVHDEQRFRIGASIGLVAIDKRWDNTEALMRAADTACFAAKDAGRNRVHRWLESDLTLRARNSERRWVNRLERALDENRFVLYAQRIYSLDGSSQSLNAEVLLRMTDDDGQLIPPGAFLPAAERFDLYSRIDRWVLRSAVEKIRQQSCLSCLENISINLSGRSIGDREFHREALDILSQAGPDVCRCLCLEITETAAITNLVDAAAFIDQVHRLGVRVALDDFGAGASSFGYLKSLPVDLIKIDGQYIQNIIDEPLDHAAVRCFVEVAGLIGVKTVAEFVDSAAILEKLREVNIDYAQGFLAHQPEPIDDVLRAASRGSTNTWSIEATG